MVEVDYNKQTVDATKWSEMSLMELIEQRNRMFDRYDFLVSQKKNAAMIIEGINKLDAIITAKSVM